MRWPLLFRDGLCNLRPHGFYTGGVVGHELALFVDQKLVEIPTHGGVEGAVFRFVAQPTVKGVLGAAFHIQFFADGEGDAIIFLTKAGNFCCPTGFLLHELVAWASDDDEFVGVFFLQLLEFGVLRGVSTFGSGIHNKDFFAFVVGQVQGGVAIQRLQWNVVYAFRCRSCLTWVDGFGFTKHTGGD